MVRKLRAEGLTDIAVMEVAQVGVRTRTRARAEEAMEAAGAANSTLASKRRKLNSDEVKNISSSFQLRNRIINNDTGTEMVSENRCSSLGLELSFDNDRVSTSCCSSHGSSERIEIVDLKDIEVETSTYCGRRERRETTPSSELEAEPEAEAGESDDMDSSPKSSSDAVSRRRSAAEKMPTDSEIEDFFAAAETKLVNQFSEKYNFDFVKEKPVKGNYEWIQLSR